MKFIICNTNDNYWFRDTDKLQLDNKYFNMLEQVFPIKRVKQPRFNTIISLKDLSDIVKIKTITNHEIIIADMYNMPKGCNMAVLEIYDDYRE